MTLKLESVASHLLTFYSHNENIVTGQGCQVHVISRKVLRDFCQRRADACEPLYNWYRVTSKASWHSLVEVQLIYPQAETVGNFTVFNIKGNHYRLIADIICSRQRIYIKSVLTHAEYDKDQWKHDPHFKS